MANKRSKMEIKLNSEIKINLNKLVVSRLLIQANSGGGKSWAIRRIVEQAYGNIQIIILDPEGEFGTLREKYDFVLAGKGGDTPAEPRSAALLAKRLLELKVSAIIDLYELPIHGRKQFVRLFVESMVNAPKELWHPCLVIIDEAHAFCPEKDEAESAGAIKDLASRGRKRMFCPILATQRISKLAKDAAAECNNKLIGRSAIDIDMKRAADELGFTTKEQFYSLRKLVPGEFFAFGPAISDEVIQTKIGGIATSEMKIGGEIKVAPPTDGIKKILAKLADLPAEADKELRTMADLRKENAELRRHRCPAVNQNPVKIERIEVPAVGKRALEGLKTAEAKMRKMLNMTKESVLAIQISIDKLAFEIAKIDKKATVGKFAPIPKLSPKLLVKKYYPENTTQENNELTTPERRILNAIAWMNSIGIDDPEKTAIAFLADYKFGGGAFNNPCGSLRTKGLVGYRGNNIVLTEAGRAIAEVPDTPLTTEELHNKVLARLETPHRRLLVPLLEAYPEALTNEELAEKSTYTFGSGGFNNPKGRLRTLGLIEYLQGGKVRARDILFLK